MFDRMDYESNKVTRKLFRLKSSLESSIVIFLDPLHSSSKKGSTTTTSNYQLSNIEAFDMLNVIV